MKFCQHCGKELMDEAVICPGCGCSVQATNSAQVAEVDESVSVGLVVLAVLIPLFGIIYWPVKARHVPNAHRLAVSQPSFLGLWDLSSLWQQAECNIYLMKKVEQNGKLYAHTYSFNYVIEINL